MQNVRDFTQTKELDNGINSSFLLNEHSDPRIFFQLSPRNSLMKNIFEEDKKFDSRARFFFENSSYFGQGEDFKLTTELSKKVQYSRNQVIKKRLK